MVTNPPPPRARSRTKLQLLIFLGGFGVAAVLWLCLDLFLNHRFEAHFDPSREHIFAIEMVIFCLIFAPFALFEIAKLGRLLSKNTEPEAPRFRTIISLLFAFAGSLAIYLGFVWASINLKQ